MKNYLLFIAIFLISFKLFGQTTLSIEDEAVLTVLDCDSLTITAGEFSAPNLYITQLTFPDSAQLTAIINPDYFGQVWDVSGGSELRFYSGFDQSAELIGSYNTANYPNGFLLNMHVEFLRIEFDISEGSSGDGFDMALFCFEGLQGLPLAKFKPVITEEWYYDNDAEMEVLRSCVGDSLSIAVQPIFLNPELENQNVDSMLIKWSFGDLSFERGKGITEVSHAYSSGVGYLVTVYSQDSLGAESYLKFLVRNSPQPEFELDENQSYCLGEPVQISGGMNGDQVVGAEAGFGETSVTEFYGTMLYLPDGNNDSYTTTIEVNGFPEGTAISSASDLAALCVNMEHSFLGDLEMGLTCPDGTMVAIFNSYNSPSSPNQLFPNGFGGGGIFLGDAEDGYPDGEPGIGFDYCFSDDADLGAIANIFSQPAYQVPVSQGMAIASGTYLPEESFAGFIGCPVNGDWTLTVRDNWMSDDGFIFDWSLAYSEDLSSFGFQNELVAASWDNNDWISAVNDGSIEVTPPNTSPTDLTFIVSDANGCAFSKVITVQVSDTLAEINDPEICELNRVVQWPNSLGNLAFVSGPSPDVIITYSGNYFEVQVPETGEYTFEFNYSDCSSSPAAHLIFLDPNNPACLTGIEEINLSENIALAPNPVKTTTNLLFELQKAQAVQIVITTVDGKVVSNEIQNFSDGSQTKEIDMQQFENGTYLITLKGETFRTSKVLIKQ